MDPEVTGFLTLRDVKPLASSVQVHVLDFEIAIRTHIVVMDLLIHNVSVRHLLALLILQSQIYEALLISTMSRCYDVVSNFPVFNHLIPVAHGPASDTYVLRISAPEVLFQVFKELIVFRAALFQ